MDNMDFIQDKIRDEIRIEDLEVYAHHGVFPEETKNGQVFVVRAVLFTDLRKAGVTDDLTCSTHYGEVCQFMTKWMQEHTFLLIESVAERLATALLLEYPLIRALELEIRKPHAPIELPFGCVSVKVTRGWHKVYLSIGSNMGDKETFIQNGIHGLGEHPLIQIQNISNIIQTQAYGGVEQDVFLNGAIEIVTILPPLELLQVLHDIEQDAGRERTIRWGPRTLDLDILFYDKMICENEQLIIPHVDLQNRFFVLKPMSEIAPFFRHPILHKTILELLTALEES